MTVYVPVVCLVIKKKNALFSVDTENRKIKHCVLFTVRYWVASQPLMRTSLSCQQTVSLPAEVMRVEAYHRDLLPSPSTSPISICNRTLVKHRQSDSFWPAALLLCMWEVFARAAGHPCRNSFFCIYVLLVTFDKKCEGGSCARAEITQWLFLAPSSILLIWTPLAAEPDWTKNAGE